MSIVRMSAAAAALATLFVAHSALAVDYKDFSGHNCKAYFGSQAARISMRVDSAYNETNTGTWIACPLVRDDHNNTFGINYMWVNIHHPNYSPSNKLTCYLRSNGREGVTKVMDSDSSTSRTDRWLYLDVNSSETFGSYNLYCYLPGKAKIHAYFLNEFAGE